MNLRSRRGDEDACVAFALRRLADVAKAPPEREVTAFDAVLEGRPVELGRDHVDERGVALELGQPEGRPQAPDDDIGEVGQDVLGVIELDTGEVARVPADVGDDETGRIGSFQLHGKPFGSAAPF